MTKSYYKTFPAYLLIDLVIIISTFSITYFSKYNSRQSIVNSINLPDIQGYAIIFSIWLIIIVILFKRHSLYVTDRLLTMPREMLKIAANLLYAAIFISTIIFFVQYKFFSREVFIISLLALFVLLTMWRALKRLVIRKLITDGYHNINVAIIGTGDIAILAANEIKKNPYWGFKLVGFIDNHEIKHVDEFPVLGKVKDCIKIVKKHFIDELILTSPSEADNVNRLIKQARNMHIGLKLILKNIEAPLTLPNVSYLGFLPLLSYEDRKRYAADFILKRLFDFFAALILLLLFSPIGLIVASLIKLDSKGSVFYTQKRAGHKGRHFNFYKFRSMVKGADKAKAALLDKNEIKDGVIFKIKKDPRITKIGYFLRKHSLDELPQLFNVLKGNMSLVGPRPPVPEEVEKYSHDYMQRLSIRPGMTCLSQVRGRSNLTFRKWVKWDLWYINNWSFWLDLKILWLTVGVVLKGKGAY